MMRCIVDVVIVSYPLLKNPNYFRVGSSKNGAPRKDEEDERIGWVRSHLKVRSSLFAALVHVFLCYCADDSQRVCKRKSAALSDIGTLLLAPSYY
jgi:hypothetical protein